MLEPHLQIVPVAEGDFLHLPGDEIQQVYFLHKGRNAISTASVGSEGAIGTIAGTGFVHAFTRALVQAPGVASKIAVSPFRRAVSKSESINDLLTRYHMALMCQVQQKRSLKTRRRLSSKHGGAHQRTQPFTPLVGGRAYVYGLRTVRSGLDPRLDQFAEQCL